MGMNTYFNVSDYVHIYEKLSSGLIIRNSRVFLCCYETITNCNFFIIIFYNTVSPGAASISQNPDTTLVLINKVN